MGEPVRSESFFVELAQTGRAVEVHPGVSILDTLREEGVDVVSSCGEGTCGTCETRVLAGEPDHRDSILDKEAKKRGDRMMICVSRSCVERLTLDI
jgi:ferredoxin